jgi:hypothetical protein
MNKEEMIEEINLNTMENRELHCKLMDHPLFKGLRNMNYEEIKTVYEEIHAK